MKAGVALLVAAIGFLSGCVSPESVACGDGRQCPAEYTCATYGCLSPPQIEACAGKSDGDECTLGSTGVCREGGCAVAVCGNGVMELDEACDDGNQFGGDGCNGTCSSTEVCGNGIVELDEQCDCGDAAHPGGTRCAGTFNNESYCSASCTIRRCGDGAIDPGEVCDFGDNDPGGGCSFDCKSNETCGNGTVDYFAGEQCDDTNLRSRDGCSASCFDEQLAWHMISQSGLPPARSSTPMVFDAARNRLVVFGGGGGGSLIGDTWEANGAEWTETTPADGPSVRSLHGLAYDAKRGRVVMFGGLRSSLLGDTWEYDGSVWTKRSPATSPSPRAGAVMTYDAVRERVVLFGGAPSLSGGPLSNETWEYDGTTWTKLAPSTSPPARYAGAITYDSKRGVIVMFGGSDGGTEFSDTWEYNGTTWTQRSTTTTPSARYQQGLAYDPARNRVVMFGSNYGQADTWEYDGSDWTLRSPTTSPSGRASNAMAYDPVTRRVVLVGGYDPSTFQNLGDVWDYDGTTWKPRTPAIPTAINIMGFAHDARRGVTVMFGGYTNTRIDETWELDDGRWIQRTLSPRPPARSHMMMAYDSKRSVIVMFGGADSNGLMTDTWEYDGIAWTNRNPATHPGARYLSGMAYDEARQRVVLFGGADSSNNLLAETWEYDGTTWTQRFPTTSPSASQSPLAYDRERGCIVLFGGQDDFGTFKVQSNQTWEYDGTTWKQIATPTKPSPRLAQLVYNTQRRRVMMFSGTQDSDTWEYDGTTWTELTLPKPLPPGRDFGAIAYDETHGRVVVFGGTVGSNAVPRDVWALAYESSSPVAACTSGVDYDHDGKAGCIDDDCWGVCNGCPPGTPAASCPLHPRCGDAICDPAESCRSCPADCTTNTAACPTVCGDFYCDPTESTATCPGDC